MRVNFARALTLVIGAILAGPALAQDATFVGRGNFPQVPDVSSYYDQSNDDRGFLTSDEPPSPSLPAQQQQQQHQQQYFGDCASCNGGNVCDSSGDCCDDCGDFCAVCNQCPYRGLIVTSDIQTFRGIGDFNALANRTSNNEGGSTGFNYGTRLGAFSDLTGIGLQVGGSYGIFDWSGRPANFASLNNTSAQTQVFLTAGFFRKANGYSNLSFGVVHDWMINQNWGAFAVNPTLGQWRAQIAYATDAWNEFGFWGTLRDKGSTNDDCLGNPITIQAINQANLFWHHKWELGADSFIWAGIPQDSRLGPLGGSLGDFLVGGSITAPLNDYISLYGNMQYMHPSASAGSAGFAESAWYVAFGLAYYIGGNARTTTVAGNCWLPLMPIANNGNFLTDAFRSL